PSTPPPPPFPDQPRPESPQSFHALPRRSERLVGEVERLAVVRLPEEEPHGRRIHALLTQVARGEEVAEPLRHLGAAHVEELPMQPPARERPPRRRLPL